MSGPEKKGISRRDFVKVSLGAAACCALGPAAGCVPNPYASLPSFDRSRTLRIINGNVVDVRAGAVRPGVTVCVRDGKIVSMDRNGAPAGPDDQVLDVGGRWVAPGLIDAHCHTTMSCTFRMRPTEAGMNYRQLERQLASCVETGVTTVRDAGGFPGLLRRFDERIGSGSLRGPRIVACNSIVNIMGGHPDIPPTEVNRFAEIGALFIGSAMTNFESDADLARALERNASDGRFIKITVDRDSIVCGKGRIPVYEDRHLKTIFDFAERRSLPVVCHCLTRWGFDRMVQYPVHSFEHIVADAPLSDADARALADRKIAVVPTMTLAQSYLLAEAYDRVPNAYLTDFVRAELAIRSAYLKNVPASHCDPAIHRTNMAHLALYRKLGRDNLLKNKKFLVKPETFFAMATTGAANLKRLREAGVLIGCGMDAGTPLNYFGALWREIEMLGRIGFSPAEALRCATASNARIIGAEDRLGAVEPGKAADLVVLDGNPLDGLSALRAPRMVLQAGRVVHAC